MNYFLIIVFLIALIKCTSQETDKTKFTADWESLFAHNQSPEWFSDLHATRQIHNSMSQIWGARYKMNS